MPQQHSLLANSACQSFRRCDNSSGPDCMGWAVDGEGRYLCMSFGGCIGVCLFGLGCISSHFPLISHSFWWCSLVFSLSFANFITSLGDFLQFTLSQTVIQAIKQSTVSWRGQQPNCMRVISIYPLWQAVPSILLAKSWLYLNYSKQPCYLRCH